MVKFESAIRLPFSDWKKLLIGSVIIFVGYFVMNVADVISAIGELTGSESMTLTSDIFTLIGFVPALIAGLFISGYTVRCAKAALKGKNILPEWDKWGNMFVSGLKISMISVLYIILLAILWIVALVLLEAMPVIGILLILAVLAISVVIVYSIPMAIMRSIAEDRFWAAFNLREVLKIAFTKKYLGAFFAIILYALVIMIVSFLATIITFITIIGPFIVSAVIQAATSITIMNIYGQAYREITGEKAASQPATANVRIYKARK